MKKLVTGCIDIHPSMELSEFNSHYLTNLLDTLSSESKTLFLLGGFNVDLLKITKTATFKLLLI